MRDNQQNKTTTGRPRAANQRRRAPAQTPLYFDGTVDELVAAVKPSAPMYVVRPDILAAKAREFNALFPGTGMYAVKCNPERPVLQALYRAGVHSFDVASIEEVRAAARAAPKAKLYFMHPVKSPEAIREAYEQYGVRAFVLDSQEELYKILRETNLAADLMLFVRMALPHNDSAQIDFSSKFGATSSETIELLRLCRPVASQVGLCFHVGTQAEDPEAFARAIALSRKVIDESGVTVDCLNVGGGFPVSYCEDVPPLAATMKVIARALKEYGLDKMQLMAEPGRYLVADSTSLIVRVERRRDNVLYLNDGTYGGLFDAGPLLNLRFPVRAVRPGAAREVAKAALTSYRFAGPTCDSIDMMEGPFNLPADMKEGEWIEVSKVGAYSAVLRTNFNGFGKAEIVYMKETAEAKKDGTLAAARH